MPPSYGSQKYWDERFSAETDPFEWLEAPHAVDPFVLAALRRSSDAQPEILHIGCGTSRLSYHLRTLVPEPSQIHNVDYSQVAIDIGRDREHEFEDEAPTRANNGISPMRWDSINLLDHTSVLGACKPSSYSVIVDKSTSDSISCSDDVSITVPYALDIPEDAQVAGDMHEPSGSLHPLHLLAVHLALIAKPEAHWIALSYSNDRFPFADGLYSSRPHFSGFPDTGKLWKLVEKREIESTNDVEALTSVEGSQNSVTHRPKILNWVYILQRSDVPLYIRGGHI